MRKRRVENYHKERMMRFFTALLLGLFSSVVLATEGAKESCLTLGYGNSLPEDAKGLVVAYMDEPKDSGLKEFFWTMFVANKAQLANRYDRTSVTKCYTPAQRNVFDFARLATHSESPSIQEFAMSATETNRGYWERGAYRRALAHIIASRPQSFPYIFHERAWKEFLALGKPEVNTPWRYGMREIWPIESYRHVIDNGYLVEYRELAAGELLALSNDTLRGIGRDFEIDWAFSSIVRYVENKEYVARASARLLGHHAAATFLGDILHNASDPYRREAISELLAHLSGSDAFEQRQSFEILRRAVEQTELSPSDFKRITDALRRYEEMKSK